jgi:hypothetical protein
LLVPGKSLCSFDSPRTKGVRAAWVGNISACF